MIDKKDILLFVPDGVGIRNYIYSDVFKDRDARLHLYHNFDADTLERLKAEVSLDSDFEIPVYKESLLEKYYRELIHYSRLKIYAKERKNPTILHLWHKPRKGLKQKLFYRFVTFMGWFYNSYKRILKLELKYQNAIRKNPMYSEVYKQLQGLSLNRVFCTHQRALKAPVIFAVAEDLGIPSTTVIYSWDNIPKARLALKAQQYLVWSDHMKSELQQFYQEIKEEQIRISGTPQFEAYANKANIIPKEEFYNTYKLDPYKKIICFSGDDEFTSPNDPQYLEDLAAQLTDSGLAKDYQILFRRCPVDVSGRYDYVVEKYNELIAEVPPLWNFNASVWSAVYPTKSDVKLLVSTAYYCEAVVNLGSTMAFDFGMFNKPCIYINYDQPAARGWSVDTIYRFEHFNSMPDSSAVFWWDRPDALPGLLSMAKTGSTTIKDWMNIVIGDVEASETIYHNLIDD